MAEMTRDEVIDHVRGRISLEFVNLAGMDLRGIDFRKTNLGSANLAGCRLAGAGFQEAILAKADLTEADLSDANLTGADLSKATLARADLSGALAANAKLVGANLRQANLSQADLTHSDLHGADLHFAKCSGVDFRMALLTGASLEKAFLRGALFRGADLAGVRFEGAVGLDPAVLAAAQKAPDPVEPSPSASGPLPANLVLNVSGAGPVDYGAARPLRAPAAPKASRYHAPMRPTPAVIFTTGGWIRGVFHVPVMHGFLEHLNLAGDLLKLTEVVLPYLDLELGFFGLRRNKALLVMPDCDPATLLLAEPTADYHVHRVSFLLEGGTVTGSLAIEEDIRVSDYLANHDQFVALRNCRFGAHDARAEEETHFPLLFVNGAAVVGASDERIKEG